MSGFCVALFCLSLFWLCIFLYVWRRNEEIKAQNAALNEAFEKELARLTCIASYYPTPASPYDASEEAKRFLAERRKLDHEEQLRELQNKAEILRIKHRIESARAGLNERYWDEKS